MNYSHLDDEALVRHVQNDEIDCLVLELANRLEMAIDHSDYEYEYEELSHEYDTVKADQEEAEQQLTDIEDAVLDFIDKHHLDISTTYQGSALAIVELLCEKIGELANRNKL